MYRRGKCGLKSIENPDDGDQQQQSPTYRPLTVSSLSQGPPATDAASTQVAGVRNETTQQHQDSLQSHSDSMADDSVLFNTTTSTYVSLIKVHV